MRLGASLASYRANHERRQMRRVQDHPGAEQVKAASGAIVAEMNTTVSGTTYVRFTWGIHPLDSTSPVVYIG